MIILHCRTCNGTGEVTNEQFRICQALKSHATKRYFHLPMDEEAGDERAPTARCLQQRPGKSGMPGLRRGRGDCI